MYRLQYNLIDPTAIMPSTLTAIAAIFNFLPFVSSFLVHHPLTIRRTYCNCLYSTAKAPEFTPADLQLASNFFQLEEKEHSESCITEIFLSDDGSITLSRTDGPPPIQASGSWIQDGNTVEMKIVRLFRTGQKGTDVGQFEFEVERSFTGVLSTLGDLIVVDGSMHFYVSSTFFVTTHVL